MTPEEFRTLFVPRLAQKYLKEADKVSMVAAYTALTAGQKQAIQTIFESGNATKAGTALQKARQNLSNQLATTRINEIIADGNLTIGTELDELL